ncbi:hypothetical protein BIY24_11035 [Halobacteriovorax marinus]|uniref:hypothetical protein n=1 Tax=Halobacteriovorax marinus TaxID=97084 RepID=UPI000BC33246|nr:hypothetical protein [Halobacteriovorax marinus]ATH08463.1 hypothetical protein BIY24_11035 [Halobacteriovorax marinus]
MKVIIAMAIILPFLSLSTMAASSSVRATLLVTEQVKITVIENRDSKRVITKNRIQVMPNRMLTIQHGKDSQTISSGENGIISNDNKKSSDIFF